MLDLLAFLTGQTIFEVDSTDLDREVYEAKRKRFIELGGELRATSHRGDTLTLIDRRDHGKDLKMSIWFDGMVIEADQMEGRACEHPNGRREEAICRVFSTPLQSALTSIQVEEILKSGTSHLSSLNESYLLHKPLLEAFNRHLSEISNQQTPICPIT